MSITGVDVRLFDRTLVSVDGSVEHGPYVKLGFAHGSFTSAATMTPDEALQLADALKIMAGDVTRASGTPIKDKMMATHDRTIQMLKDA